MEQKAGEIHGLTREKGGEKMPGGDRTGPLGAGPRTGRAAGFCAGYEMPGYVNPVPGYGRGMGGGRGFGYGRGRGWRFRRWAGAGWSPWGVQPMYAGSGPATPEQEKEILTQEADALQRELNAINKRISDLETTD